MFDEDDVSKVTLLAWPGQGYGRHRLSSGLLVPFVSFVRTQTYLTFCKIWIFVLYLYSWLVGVVVVIYMFFCGFHHELGVMITMMS